MTKEKNNYQLYDNWSDNLAWSAVSTTTISVQKSGPSSKHNAFISFGRFGLPPDILRTVNCSSGPSITKSGPKITLNRNV